MAIDQIGFIGAGQMARALASGLVKAQLVPAAGIIAADPFPAGREGFSEAVPGAQTTDDNIEAAAAKVLVLSVKPQKMAEVLAGLRDVVTADHLVLSIAAGVTLSQLSEGLGGGPRLVRVMPNTPCLVGKGASGYALGPTATREDAELVGQLMSAVGYTVELEERLLDAVTGLSGSGPAFVYVIIEALSDGGVQMGLPRDVATALAAHTVRGAAEMTVASGEHTGVLRDRVASPGGTTIAGLATLEDGGIRAALIGAVEAATHRAKELGQ